MSKFKNKILIILYIILFIICCSTIVTAAGNILDKKTYDEGGNQDKLTDYDFAKKAASKYKWYNLDSNKLIGNYVYMNLGVNSYGGEGKATIDMKHAFCLGHGNSQSTYISQKNGTWLYRLETIWDIDMNADDLPRNVNCL